MRHQRLETGSWPRHRHATGYAALVLCGNYEEIGDTGRWQIEAGDLVYHRPYEAHSNTISRACSIVNIPIADHLALPPVCQLDHPDELLWALAHEEKAVTDCLKVQKAKRPILSDWPDLLARDLRKSTVFLAGWAAQAGIRAETVSRGFRRTYGVSPARYAREAQTRRAYAEIIHSDLALAQIAFDNGFSDQSHLTRSVTAMTGKPPGAWRKVKTVQDYNGAAD
ncbi:MAG: helix-turn-helix transcriptional regulator [Erythrobacter sp.]